jgi:hypothetical protein
VVGPGWSGTGAWTSYALPASSPTRLSDAPIVFWLKFDSETGETPRACEHCALSQRNSTQREAMQHVCIDPWRQLQ